MGKLAEKRKAEWDKMMKKVIFEATMAVLNEHGFDGLRMDRVARAAEVATGTLYNYFKDKNELLLDVINAKFEPIHQEFLKVLHSDMSPIEKLETIVRRCINSITEHRSLVIIVTAAEGLSLPIKNGVNQKREIIHRLFAEIIEQGIEQGIFRQMDPLRTARLIFGAINGLVQALIHVDEEPPATESDISECLTLFFSGLLA